MSLHRQESCRQGKDVAQPCADDWRQLKIQTTAEAGRAIDELIAAMAGAGYGQQDQFGMRLAFEEALVNAYRHGNRGDPSRWVQVRYHVNGERVLAEVEDEGEGFDPGNVADPLAPGNLSRPSGRGLLLMRHYLTWMRHNQRGNNVLLCKHRSGS